jgi:DNA repair exonuclease SbcCD ATPase subunit
MPDGLFSPQKTNAPAPASAFMPMSQQSVPGERRLPPELEALEKKVSETVLNIAARVKLLEQKTDNLRGHLELIDGSLIEKHKSVISEIRDVEDGMRSLRADIDNLKDMTERIAKRMEALASKEEVKVLERYVELWQPLQFVTRAEVKTMVQSILKEHGVKIKEQGGS